MNRRHAFPALAMLALAAACGDGNPTQVAETPPGEEPQFLAASGENVIAGGGACMGDDAFAGGRTSGMQSASNLNCTANDVSLAVATITEYSTDSVTFLPVTGPVSCVEGTDIWVKTTANLVTNATERYDVGIWLPDLTAAPNQDPANAVTGKCRQWNLLNDDPGGAVQLDGDQCGDVSSANATAASPTTQDLGTLKLKCEDVDPRFPGQVAVGACLGWNNNRSGSLCPLGGSSALNFRYGTTPETKSKCNCDPMLLPISIVQQGKLELRKALGPTGDAGLVNLIIRTGGSAGAVVDSASNVGHGGTTGAGGTTLDAGAYHLSETAGTGTSLSNYTVTGPACVNRGDQSAVTVTGGVVQLQSGADVVCTITNTRKPPQLSISKTPDAGQVNQGDTATFTITASNAAGAGSALNTVLTDTLPNSGLDWEIDLPVPSGCSISTIVVGSANRELLTCNIGELNAGASFVVSVSATIPSNFLQPAPGRAGAPLNAGDGNLVVNGSEVDWATASLGIDCLTSTGCKLDQPSGSGDDSFGGGTDENTTVPTVGSGSIPPNKSDLTRFYIANERVGNFDFLYLGWRRVQDPSGTTNMDFELNQSTQLSANGVTPVRTAGDLLISYDLSQGGTNPTISFRRWITSGTCGWSSGKLPCWGPSTVIAGAVASINAVSVSDPFAPSPTTLSPFTFGEAGINLQQSGIFQPGVCLNFGRAYLKSRSSDSPSSALKDFIAPVAINVNSCVDQPLNNRAWVVAATVSAISDTGLITVKVDPIAALFSSGTSTRLAAADVDAPTTVGSVTVAMAASGSNGSGVAGRMVETRVGIAAATDPRATAGLPLGGAGTFSGDPGPRAPRRT